MKRIVLFLATNIAVLVVLSVDRQHLRPRPLADGRRHQLHLAARVLGGDRLRRRDHLAADLQVDGQDEHRRAGHRRLGRHHRVLAGRDGEEARRRRPSIGMPEVAIFEGAPNAFATGAFKNSALVAVSTGLLQSMSSEEVEAVLGHEVAHVANGDMVTLTLIQGVLNTFVVFLSRDGRHDRRQGDLPHRARRGPGLLHRLADRRRSCSASSPR